ncbi:MAG: hypothetical protein HYW25_00990 [Candidatus Aenigmarchaeota archaeon]|nr:hypothetical protein [Candidatus Aenigmarchaeota archaeon]
MILIDTSVYINAIADKELEDEIREAAKKAVMMSSLVIEKEIDSAAFHLRRIGKKEDAERLKELYNLSAGGKIGLTPFVSSLTTEYFDAVGRQFGKKRAKKMIDDFRIVAGSSAAALSAIGTFNRKTMANEYIVRIYKEINEKHKLRTPGFIKEKAVLIKFLSSL